MKRAAAVAIALTIVLSSCGRGPTTPPARGDQSTATPREQGTEEAVDVVRSGFTIHGERVGIGAILRVRGVDARRDIHLAIAYYADGRRLGIEQDTLAFCPPRTDCPWGQTFAGETLGSLWRSIDDVRVTIRDRGGAGDDVDIEQLSTTVGDDSIVVRPLGPEGTAYVLVFDGSTPRFGMSSYLSEGDRRSLTYPRDDFPPASADAFRTFFYPGPVPGSVYGPVD